MDLITLYCDTVGSIQVAMNAHFALASDVDFQELVDQYQISKISVCANILLSQLKLNQL